jgi:3-hydroxyisobutyrate dehydrogenase-like beta-hydroxyacid dehydrogenase
VIQSVAVIGVGAMGAPMARRVHAAGFDVTVCDRDEQALAAFAAQGVKVAREAADCAGADLVLVLVSTPQQAWDVVAGEHGLLSRRDGQGSVVAVMATINPGPMRRLEEAVAGTGLRIIDTPISGGVIRAESGDLSVIMGGDDAVLDEVTPVYEAFSRIRLRVGDVGSAQTAKVVNNMLGVASFLVAGEAYRIALEHGLKLSDVMRVMEVSSGRNWLSADLAESQSTFAAYSASAEASEAVRAILRKDIDLALELGGDIDGQFPVAQGLRSVLETLGPETYRSWAMVGKPET